MITSFLASARQYKLCICHANAIIITLIFVTVDARHRKRVVAKFSRTIVVVSRAAATSNAIVSDYTELRPEDDVISAFSLTLA